MDPLRKLYEEMSEWKRTDERHPDHDKAKEWGWNHIGSYKHSSGRVVHRFGNGPHRLELAPEENFYDKANMLKFGRKNPKIEF